MRLLSLRSPSHRPSGSVALTLTLVLPLLGAASSLAQVPQRTVDSRSGPARDYRLFVGIDVKVLHQNDFTKVTNFSHNTARLGSADHATVTPAAMGPIRFDHATKLSLAALTIDALAYRATVATDPNERYQNISNSTGLSNYFAARADDALAFSTLNLTTPETSAPTTGGNNTAPQSTPASTGAATNPGLNKYQEQLQQTERMRNAARDGTLQTTPEAKITALQVSFEITAPQPVSDAYCVGLARIRAPDGNLQDVVFLNELPDLGPQPTKIEVEKDGLPEKFEVLSVELHVYREGQEIVTNHSAKQFALTRDEALEYLALERISSHRGATLPAAPAWTLAPPALLGAKDPAAFDCPLTVQIDAKGNVVGIDPHTVAPPQIAAVVRDLAFFPALDQGVAVAGTTQVNLADFFR